MKLVTMTVKQKDIMRVYIGKMCYFNAGDSAQYIVETEKRKDLKIAARIDIIKWLSNGLDLDELKDFVNVNGSLCKFSDFISSKMLDDVLTGKGIDL